MDWRQRLLAHGQAVGRTTYEDALGVGIEFEDGCDVFWVLPGEVMSTVPVPAEGPSAPEDLIARYDEINRVRERALHVIRHCLASKRFGVDRSRSGSWGLEWEGGASSTLAVGAGLTAVARDTRDAYAAVSACLKNSWAGKVPSRKRAERYLNTKGPPENERPMSEEPPTRPLVPPTVRGVLSLMGLCKALESPETLTSPESVKAAAAPTGRIGQTLLRLADRLPQAKASADLLKPASVSIDFEDGYASFDVDTRSRPLARRIRDRGPAAVGDELADEFLALNAARSRVLRAVRQAAAQRGWRKHEFGLAFFGIEKLIHLGASRREVSLAPTEKLTDLLRHTPLEAAVRQLFAEHGDFAEACVAALRDPLPDGQIDLPDGPLAPREAPSPPPLRTLDADLVAAMDRFADERLGAYMDEERTIWEYRNAEVYDPPADTWARPGDWVRVAERFADAEWPHPMATVILLDAGDPRGDSLARRFLEHQEPHHEVGAAEVEILWRYRHRFPEVARRWFSPDGYDDVPFAKERASLGDPVAVRRRAAELAEDDVDDDPTPESAARLPPERREQLRRDLLAWARTDFHWAAPQVDRLRVALRMGWRDVADALTENPYLLAGLLTHERRADQFDEPGMLLAREFLLVWSKLSPTPFLARLLATARATDLVALAEQAARASAVGKPDVAKNLPSTLDIYRHWLKHLEPAIAIAWKRCRSAAAA